MVVDVLVVFESVVVVGVMVVVVLKMVEIIVNSIGSAVVMTVVGGMTAEVEVTRVIDDVFVEGLVVVESVVVCRRCGSYP